MGSERDSQRPDWVSQIIDRDCRREDLLRAAQWARELESSPQAQQRLDEVETLRRTLSDDLDAAEPIGGWDAYRERLRVAVAEAAPSPNQVRRSWPVFRAYHVVWAALIIVTTGLVFWFSSEPRRGLAPIRPADTTLVMPMPSHAELQQKLTAFTQVTTLLDHRTAWLSLDGPEPDIGVVNMPLGSARLLLVRLLVRVGQEAMSQRDLLIIPGQDAQLTLPVGKYEARYVLSTPRSADTQDVSIWAEVRRRGGGEALGAMATRSPWPTSNVISLGQISTLEGRFELGFGAQMIDPGSEVAP